MDGRNVPFPKCLFLPLQIPPPSPSPVLIHGHAEIDFDLPRRRPVGSGQEEETPPQLLLFVSTCSLPFLDSLSFSAKMSVAVMPTPFYLEKYAWPGAEVPAVAADDDEDRRTPQFDIWSVIQVQKDPAADAAVLPCAYSPMRRSSSSLSERSLQVCTESLGSETGSDEFSSSADGRELDSLFEIEVEEEESNEDVSEEGRVWIKKETEEVLQWPQRRGKELASVNYHCGVGRRTSPPRAFPPPLSSISRRDGPCFHMRPRRCDGRLVVEAVAVPSRNYLHAHREGGRLLLSFVDAVVDDASFGATPEIERPIDDQEPNAINENEETEEEEKKSNHEEEDDEDDDEEEHVEVVDRGTMIEVKISTQPQQQTGGAVRVPRSSLVINKFVGGSSNCSSSEPDHPPPDDDADAAATTTINATLPTDNQWQPRRLTTATAAAAVVVASALSASAKATDMPADNKLLFTSKRRNRVARRCSERQRPLFILEPCCIATSSS